MKKRQIAFDLYLCIDHRTKKMMALIKTIDNLVLLTRLSVAYEEHTIAH